MTMRPLKKVFGVPVYPLSDILSIRTTNILLLIAGGTLLTMLAGCSSSVEEQSGPSWTDGTVVVRPLANLLPYNLDSGQSTDLELLLNALTTMVSGSTSLLTILAALVVLLTFGAIKLLAPPALQQKLVGYLKLILQAGSSLFRKRP
jgi:hypothetical protein